MNGPQIRKRIEQLNEEITEYVKPWEFTLNEMIQKIENEIKELRSVCPHEYINDTCIYCGMTKEDKNAKD